MTEERAYRSPEAFRRALTDRLRDLAQDSRWSLPQLQRQIAYDRLLARLYAADRGWVLKYPLADHVADKIMAIVQRYGDRELPSTRYRDLVDLVAIATTASVAADAVSTALASEAERRDLRLPAEFDVPDRQLWERGYAAEAGRSLLRVARILDDALAVVRPFVDPILAGSARGARDPAAGRWTA